MTDWKNLVLGGLTLVLLIVVVMWFMGWGSASIETNASVAAATDTAKPAESNTIVAKAETAAASATGAAKLAVAVGDADKMMAPAFQSSGQPVVQQQSQASPSALMGQLPQQELEQEVYNPALVPIVPPPIAPPGAVPTAKKEWEDSRDMLFVQLTDQQAPRETRVRAGRALGKFPTAGTAHVLEVVMLNDKDAVVRFTAAQALGLTGSGMNCAGLERSIQMDSDSQVRQMAERSLGMINARKGLPPQGALTFQRTRDNRLMSSQPDVALQN